MKRFISILLIVLVLLVSVLGVGVNYSMNSPMPTFTSTPMPTPNFEVDASWIPDVLRLLKEAKSYPDWEKDPRSYIMAPIRIELYESGSNQVVLYDKFDNEFNRYLESILQQVNADTRVNTTEAYIDMLLATNKVVYLNHRIIDPFQIWGGFYSAYFVLEDHLDQGLTGAIFFHSPLTL